MLHVRCSCKGQFSFKYDPSNTQNEPRVHRRMLLLQQISFYFNTPDEQQNN